jgi:perosamine synthetase
VPLTRPLLGEAEERAVSAVLRSGMLVQGREVERFEAMVRERCRRRHAVAVASGTAALELALRALSVGPGAEVVVPDFSWPSPAHAVLATGAEPALVDVDAREWNSRPDQLAAAVTDRTAAVIVIDQLGNPARGHELEGALDPDLPVIEDAACAIGSDFPDRPCGGLGRISCLSFHPRKVITTGEGGMCLTDDDELAATLRALRNHGQRGPGDFVFASTNHRLTDMAGAMGAAQMERLEGIVEARRARAARYREELEGLGSFQLTPPGARENAQTFGLLVPDSAGDGPPTAERDRVIDALRADGIGAGALSYAGHRLPSLAAASQAAAAAGRDLATSAMLVDRGLALPLFPQMTDEDQAAVIASVQRALGGGS